MKIFFSGSSIKPEEILARLNRCPDSEQAQLKRLGRSIRKATWDEAVLLFLCGERALYRQRNPDLTDQEIDAIDLSIGSCPVQSTGGNPAERHYTHELAPEILRAFLVFEYRNGILLRNNQIDSLVELAKKELSAQTVSKQGTGSGKSKVQYPLLQYLRQRVQSILNIWPKALFPRNRDDMQQLAGQSFGQKSETFPFNRQCL